jgi:hypothetical protein
MNEAPIRVGASCCVDKKRQRAGDAVPTVDLFWSEAGRLGEGADRPWLSWQARRPDMHRHFAFFYSIAQVLSIRPVA